ncbi:MAG: DNA polymerase Y family protein, partial [Pikeienuella sp.]
MSDVRSGSLALRPAKRIVSLWLPRFAAEWRLRREGNCDEPFAIVSEQANALCLASLNVAAEQAGLGRGMSLADARSIIPNLLTRPAAPTREQAALLALARWAGRFSPFTAVDGEDALALDITGCAHLYGGENPMLEAMIEGTAAL